MLFLEVNMIWSSTDALDVLFRIRNDNQIVMRDTFDIDSPFYDTAKNVIEIITDTLMEVSEHGEGEEVFVYFTVSFLLSTCLVAKTYVCEFDHMLLYEEFGNLNKTRTSTPAVHGSD
ncbi:hypothetical protein QL285_031196 [Trifolium repens]|nr:hypothetical protein QL285_031196 [Trifolium repens]